MHEHDKQTPDAKPHEQPTPHAVEHHTSVHHPIGSAQPLPAHHHVAQPTAKRKKRWLLPVIIVTIVALVLSGGGIGAYAWYQSPQKVVNDGMLSMMRASTGKLDGQMVMNLEDGAKVTMAFSSEGNDTREKGNVSIKLESSKYDSPLAALDGIDVSADVVFDSEDMTLYFRVNEIRSVYEKVRDALVESLLIAYMNYYDSFDDEDGTRTMMREQIDENVLPIVKRLDGQWIKVDANDLDSSASSDGDTFSCISDAISKAGKDETMAKQIIDTYKAHSFVTTKDSLGSKNGAIGYSLDIDQNKARAFGDALKDTSFGKDLVACDLPEDATEADETTIDDAKVEMWVDQWSHKLRHLTFTAREEGAAVDMRLDMNFDLDADVNVEIPSDAKTFDEIKEDVEAITSIADSF